VPWVRDATDRKRRERDEQRRERRDALLRCLASLLEYRQDRGTSGVTIGNKGGGEALAKFGAALNELTVRLVPAEQPVLDVLYAMLAIVQEPQPGVEERVAQAMNVLTRWARGDLPTDAIIGEVERTAKVTFSADRKSVTPAPTA